MAQHFDKTLQHKIALKIKELRAQKNVSQDAVYLETDINIARIERGVVNCTIETIARLCRYFEITLAEFFQDF